MNKKAEQKGNNKKPDMILLSVTIPVWRITETGYQPKTNIWEDLSIAEKYDHQAIRQLVNERLKEFKDDYVALTEMVLALDWKVWTNIHNRELSHLYEDLYEKVDEIAFITLKGKEYDYYYGLTAKKL